MKQEIIKRLTSNGWVAYPDQFRTATCLFKRYATPTRCHCNDEKDELQVCIAVSEFEHMSGNQVSIEVDAAGELGDESWVKLLNYSFGSDLDKALGSIPRLLAAWEVMNNFKP